jgi:hypothetical protein
LCDFNAVNLGFHYFYYHGAKVGLSTEFERFVN